MTFRRFIFFYVLGAAFLNAVVSEPTFTERLLASLVLLLGLMPTYFYAGRNESGVPFLPVFGAIYGVYYGLPVFLFEEYSVRGEPLPHGAVEKALLLAAVGLSIMLVSYYRLPGGSIRKYLPRVDIRWDGGKAKLWSLIFCAIGLFFISLRFVVEIPYEYQQIVVFLANLFKVGIGILFTLQMSGRLSLMGKMLLWLVFLPPAALVMLGTGLLSHVLKLILFLFMIYWTFGEKIPWKTAAAAMVLVMAFTSIKSEFRQLAWEGIYTDAPLVKKSAIFTELALREGSVDEGYEDTIKRIAQLFTFAHVIDSTPGTVPYWGGETYLPLLWTPIPRIVLPDKPIKGLGQAFGHRYGLLHPLDFMTSCNCPQLVEMYANFGTVGIIVGMFIIGIIYRSIHEVFCHEKAGEGGLLIGIFLFSGLLNMESDASLVFGGLFYPALLLVIISQLMRRRET